MLSLPSITWPAGFPLHAADLPKLSPAVHTGLLAASGAVAVWYILKEWSRPRGKATNVKPSTTDRFNEEKVPENLDYVIVGSGMSGLTCAAVLARCGYRVLVLEQHDRTGGATHVYDLDGFQFDAGLHYTIPWSGPLLSVAAGPAAPKVEFLKMGTEDGTFDKIVLGDNPPFLVKHHEAHLVELRRMFPSKEDQDAIDAYMSISDGLLKSTPMYILSKFLPMWMQKIIWKLFLGHFAKYSGQAAMDVLNSITKNKQLISLLCGLWIDTGARPDTASFFMMASVFRGLPHEGGAYPSGGSQRMAEALVHAIVNNGGRVLVRAPVQEIVFEDGAAHGVVLDSGFEIRASEGVISAAGYHATFGKLVPEEVTTKYGVPRALPFGQSAGFVMVNIGIRGSPQELGIRNVNVWYHPTDASGDLLPPLIDFMKSPFDHDFPLMITFPSIKDQANPTTAPTVTCQILVMADYAWFEQWREEPSGNRAEEYAALKDSFRDRGVKALLRFYPQCKDRIAFTDVSTPLSIEHYLASPRGAAVGLDPSPQRYGGDWSVMRHLDTVTAVPRLFMTGQDTLICGVVMAQVAGLASALRLAGAVNSFKFILQTIFHS